MTAEAVRHDVVRVRLTIAYDGGGFHGFTAQPGIPTVGGALAEALERVLRAPVDLTVAGRTDRGVHAWGNVVSFDAPDAGLRGPNAADGLDLARVQRSVNSQLGPRIVVREAAVTAPAFDARRWALSRRYRYTIVNRPVPDPFLAATAWHVAAPLNIRSMALACDPLIGEHDFTSFCRVPRNVPQYTMVRRVFDARWLDLGDGVLRFQIEASSFCQQMVRAMVGTMVAMGRGERVAGEMLSILRARNRAAASRVAPPHGLCLWTVRYPAR
ncbi:MAG: tRNA pseudouridine(38-40) synthase TruA [Actinomycetota bacterium]|nr:tRNA pseudouridine(38-40) synthase TruA [Actinomycetota bacterium]